VLEGQFKFPLFIMVLSNFCFRNVVMMLSALDNPEGAAARKGKKLRRRVYHSKVRLLGSIFIVHNIIFFLVY